MSYEPRLFDALIHGLRGLIEYGSHLRDLSLPKMTLCTFEATIMMVIVIQLLRRCSIKVNRLNRVQAAMTSEVRGVLLQVRAASLLLKAQELGLKGRVLLSELLDFRFKLLAIGLEKGLILGVMVQSHGFFVQRVLYRLDGLAL